MYISRIELRTKIVPYLLHRFPIRQTTNSFWYFLIATPYQSDYPAQVDRDDSLNSSGTFQASCSGLTRANSSQPVSCHRELGDDRSIVQRQIYGSISSIFQFRRSLGHLYEGLDTSFNHVIGTGYTRVMGSLSETSIVVVV